MRLKGKVAVITGVGSGGTGYGMASAFLEAGAAVVVSEIDEAKLETSLETLHALGPVEGCVADVSIRADADRTIALAVSRFGGLDVLINNAAAMTPGLLLESMDDAIIARDLGSSLMGTIYHMQAALPHLRARGGGSIINFGSRNGVIGAAGFSMYAAAKEGVRGLSRAIAREWGVHKIRVNVICPATLSLGARTYLQSQPGGYERAVADYALGYIGDGHDDVAPVAIFLASDDSHYVTGQTIFVDGGHTML